MPKILTTVLSYNKGHYIEWQKAQEETFGSVECKDMDIIYYYGDHDKVELKDNKLYVDVPEGLFNIGHKTIKMFEYVLKNFEFDYLFRPNSSTFFIPDNVVRFIDKFAPEENCYMGAHRYSRYGDLESRSGTLPGLEITRGRGRRKLWLRRSHVNFAWGMGYVLSRDVIEKHIDDYYANAYTRRMYNEVIDDVALGMTIERAGINFINIVKLQPNPRERHREFKNMKQLRRAIEHNHVTGDYINEFVYRCKTKNPQECIDIMNVLHSAFIVKK